MTDDTQFQRAEANPRHRAVKNAKFSLDGKWKAFPKASNLLQHVEVGVFCGQIKVNQKPTIRFTIYRFCHGQAPDSTFFEACY